MLRCALIYYERGYLEWSLILNKFKLPHTTFARRRPLMGTFCGSDSLRGILLQTFLPVLTVV